MSPSLPLGAALAGIPSGIRSTGPWTGRRQLFVRFARVAETAKAREHEEWIGHIGGGDPVQTAKRQAKNEHQSERLDKRPQHSEQRLSIPDF